MSADTKLNFDDKAIYAMDLLLNHYWILRSEDPEWYRLIREREKVLRRYIDEKFGFRLTINQHLIKLEKIPVEPESWMGIQDFQEPMDYAIFCCALAFLEGKSVDEQFLLSELCQEIQASYPGEYPLDWTLYAHRKSLIRAMKVLLEFRLLREIDGDLSLFERSEDSEVLYEATIHSRYFMRSYPDDFSKYNNWEDLLKEDRKLNQEDIRRKRVYRRLFLSPGLHRKDSQDPDFIYIRNFRNRLAEDIEKHSYYKLHVFKNTAFLSNPEPKQYHTTFPGIKALPEIILQLSKYIHDHRDEYPPRENGEIILTEGELNQILEKLRNQFEKGWANFLRDTSTNALRTTILNALKDWLMAEVDEESTLIKLKSLMGVLAGSYPEDFLERGNE